MIYDKRDIVILYLSVQLLIMGMCLAHAYHVIGYLEGRESIQTEIDKAINDAVGPYTGLKGYNH